MKRKFVTSLLATSFAFAVSTAIAHASALDDEVAVAQAETEVTADEATPCEEVATDEATTEEVASKEVASDETPRQEAPVKEVAEDETPRQEAPVEEVAEDETPRQETTDEEVTDDKTATEEVTSEEVENEESTNDYSSYEEVDEDSELDAEIDRVNEMLDRVRQIHEMLAMVDIDNYELNEQGMGVRQVRYDGENIVQVQPYDRSWFEMKNASDSWSYDLKNHPIVSYDMYYYGGGEDPIDYDVYVGVFKDIIRNKLAYLYVSSDKVELAGGIKMGASIDDVKAVFGEPNEENPDVWGSSLIYVNGDNRSEFYFNEEGLNFVELINNSLFEQYDDSIDLLDVSEDIMSPLYGKDLNNGVTPDSYKKQLNDILARVPIPANSIEAWDARQISNDEIFTKLKYNGNPMVVPSEAENARYDFVNYDESHSWEYTLENYPDVKYEVFYYTDGPGIEGVDVTAGIFNENGERRLVYLDFNTDAVEFPNGKSLNLSTDYVIRKYGNPNEVEAIDNGGEHWVYNVDSGRIEFDIQNGLVKSSRLVNDEGFAKYEDKNDLKEISQDPIALYYGNKLSVGITPKLYKELAKMGWF
ncbi:MAG: hypothetical protein K5769_01845 [Pseudobutyrivibrio sp.]|nr:hypothetical protein [Pseudobutyrivibrio sp.]